MKKSKRILAVMVGITFLVGLISGCGKEEKESGNNEEITLRFATTADMREHSVNVKNEILEEFTEKTGIKIELEESGTSDFRTWLTTQFAADRGPDIFQNNIYNATQDYQSGWTCNFKELYDEESKYEPGKAWKETLPEAIRERMYITENDVPGFPATTAVVRIFVNKDMVEEVGGKIPEDWEEFIDLCGKLKDNGKIPFAFPNATMSDMTWLWFNNSLCNQLQSDLIEKMDVSGNGYIEAAELCKGMDEGLIDFTDPQFTYVFELMKEFSQYWTSDFNGLDGKTALELFERGEVAMMQNLSIVLNDLEAVVGDSFEYVVMPMPAVTTDMNANALGKSVILGGQPDGIYCINKKLEEDPKKYEAAVEFIQYMTSPEVLTKYAEELNSIPVSNSCELPEALEGFRIIEEPLRAAWFTGLNNELSNFVHRAGQEYLADEITLDEFTEGLNESYKDTVETFKTENSWSADNNYGL